MTYTKIPYRSWAVKLTTENVEVVKEYFKQYRTDFGKFNYSCLDSYYGIDIYGNLENYSRRANNEFDKMLSNEEFMRLITNKEFTQLITDKEEDYEIY